jgi:hypothetical protein
VLEREYSFMVRPKGVVSNKLDAWCISQKKNAWCTKLSGVVFDIDWNPETPFVCSCVPIDIRVQVLVHE